MGNCSEKKRKSKFDGVGAAEVEKVVLQLEHFTFWISFGTSFSAISWLGQSPSFLLLSTIQMFFLPAFYWYAFHQL